MGERSIYSVIEQPVSDIPVYRVREESGTDKVRTLHRNLLLPFMCISDSENTGVPGRKQRQNQTTQKKSVVVHDESSSESESESDGGIVIKNVQTNYRIPSETSSSITLSTAESMPESSHDYSAVMPSVEERPVVRQSTRERKPPERYGSWVYPQNVDVWYI